MSEATSLRVLITATENVMAAFGRLSFVMEEARIAMGRMWLAWYESLPWYRRLWSDVRRWFR